MIKNYEITITKMFHVPIRKTDGYQIFLKNGYFPMSLSTRAPPPEIKMVKRKTEKLPQNVALDVDQQAEFDKKVKQVKEKVT